MGVTHRRRFCSIFNSERSHGVCTFGHSEGEEGVVVVQEREGLIWFVIGGGGKVDPKQSLLIGWVSNQTDFSW